jgi:hypothetical protein
VMADRPPGQNRDGPRKGRLHAVPLPTDTGSPTVTQMWWRRQEAALRLPPLACGCRDPLICDLARWCPYWDGPRSEPVPWQCPGMFGANGRWQPCCGVAS